MSEIIYYGNDADRLEATGDILKQILKDRAEYEAEKAAKQAEAEAKAAQKAALLDRLGITEEEAKLLLA
jgi:hypothetical protein